jgi:hypothetical protein
MTSYTAEPQPERGWYRTSGEPWMVSTVNGKPIIDLTESEAKVIAFALNTVAQGMTLAASEGTYDCDVCEADSITASYDGPTDLVGTLVTHKPG